MKKLFTSLFSLLIGSVAMQAQKTDIYLDASGSFYDAEPSSITLDGKVYYTLGNSINNPTFSLDPRKRDGKLPLWTVANYTTPMTSDNFTWHKHGGFDNGAWIESKQNGDATSENSIAERWTIEPNTKYYLRFWTKNLTAENQNVPVVSLTNEQSTEGGQNEYGTTGKTLLGKNIGDTSSSSFGMANASADGKWTYTALIFDSESYTNLQFSARNLDQIGFDGFYLSKLIPADKLSEENAEEIKEEYYKFAKSKCYVEASSYDSVGYTSISRAIAEILENEESSYENNKDNLEGVINNWGSDIKDLTDYEDLDLGLILQLYNTDKKLITEVTEKLSDTEGVNKLQSALQKMNEAYEEGFCYDEKELTDFYENTLKQAKQDVLSCLRKVNKKLVDPIDMTWAIDAPNFTTYFATPSITYKKDNSGIESITYPYASLYTNEDKPCDLKHVSTEGWSNSYNHDVIWNNNRIYLHTDGTHTEINNLIPGYYTISAEILTDKSDEAKPYLVLGGEGTATASDTLQTSNGKWAYVSTPQVYNSGKYVYIQAIPINEDAKFGITNFRLLYYGNTEMGTKEYVDSLQANVDTYLNERVKFKGDKKALLETFKQANEKIETNPTLANYCDYIDEVSAIANEAVTSNSYYNDCNSWTDKMSSNYKKGDLTKEMIEALEAQLHEVIDADDATYKEINESELFYVMHNYTYQYLRLLNKIDLLELSNNTAKENQKYALTQEISRHSEASLPTTETEVMSEVENLEQQYAIILGQESYGNGDNDLTDRISNPSFDNRHLNAINGSFSGVSGWALNSDADDNAHVSLYNSINDNNYGDERYYFNAENYRKSVNCTIKQTLTAIPNGKYTLTAKMRTASDGYYLVASENEDLSNATFAAAHVQKTDKWYIDPENYQKGQEYVESGDCYGPIWTAAKDQLANDPDNETLKGIVNTNHGKGNGWFSLSLSIEVKNHTLTIGATTDSQLTLGHIDTDGNATVAYNGNYISLDDMQLTLDEDYDKGAWSITGIENIATNDTANTNNGVEAIYDLNGRRVNQLNATNKGIYIVKKNGQTLKMLKK